MFSKRDLNGIAGGLLIFCVFACEGADESARASDPRDFGGTIARTTLALPTARRSFYVSSSLGKDSWSGRRSEPDSTGTDGPLASVEAALQRVNGAAPGTHVLLRRGDRWTPAAGFEIRDAVGTATDPIVLGAYSKGAKPEIVAQHSTNVFTVRGNAKSGSSHFRLDELRITSARPAKGQVGIYIGESFHPHVPHHITLSGLTVENCGGGLTMYGDDHLVHGSRIAHNNASNGAYVGGNNIHLRYNEFEDNGLPPPDMFVHTLYVSRGNGFVFEFNEVHSATDGVKVRGQTGGVFRNNIFHDIANLGIHLGGDYEGGMSKVRVENNLFYRNAGDIMIKSESGTQLAPVDGLVIANNIVRAGPVGAPTPYRTSITLTNVPMRDVWVVNNLLFDLGEASGIRIDAGGEQVHCMNNIVSESKAGEAYNLHASVRSAGNLLIPGESALSSLHLAAVAEFDFLPTASSAQLIDQGQDVSRVLSTDHLGAPRPLGAGFDIGPYEYDPSKSIRAKPRTLKP